MTTTILILLLTLAYLAGVLTFGTLFCLADWHIRRKHGLRNEADVDAALAAYRGGAS